LTRLKQLSAWKEATSQAFEELKSETTEKLNELAAVKDQLNVLTGSNETCIID
jgi:hypothetical protein